MLMFGKCQHTSCHLTVFPVCFDTAEDAGRPREDGASNWFSVQLMSLDFKHHSSPLVEEARRWHHIYEEQKSVVVVVFFFSNINQDHLTKKEKEKKKNCCTINPNSYILIYLFNGISFLLS